MKKVNFSAQKRCLFLLTGVLFLNILYRTLGYILMLTAMIFNDGYISYYGALNGLFKLVYFEETILIFVILSAILFWITAILIPMLTRDILSRRTRMFFALSALLPIIFPQAIPYEMPKVVWLVIMSVGTVGFIAYTILSIIFIKKNFD